MSLLSSEQSNPDYREGYAGGCLKQGEPICVRRNEPYCDEGTWVTAHYMQDRNTPDTPVDHCYNDLETVTIGRCGPDGACANLAERCEDPESFVGYDETCTISMDSKNDYAPVLYGECGGRCVWSRASCLDGEAYNRTSPDCTSASVEVGACFARQLFCAVSEESCVQPGEPEEPFLTHNETAAIGGIHCYLSQVSGPPTTRSPSHSPSLRPAGEPTQTPTIVELTASIPVEDVQNSSLSYYSDPTEPGEARSSLQARQEPSGLPIEAIAGIIVVVAILVGVLIGTVAYRMGIQTGNGNKERRRRRPMKTVISNGGSDVGDNVSELGDFEDPTSRKGHKKDLSMRSADST